MDIPTPRQFFRPLDAVVLILVLSAGIFTLPWLWTGTGRRAEIRVDGKKVMRLELEGPARRASLPGFLGPVELEWGEKGVRILQAPCPNHLCVKTGWVRRRDHRLVCAPSRLAVEIRGGDLAFDAVTF
jgi:hypothetical protein